ncbi:MAG: PIN domain-containing protein [Actinomycetota bacterium]|jgi:predicted nucleic acid-binding protein|nr:PIN domain-containing protein [Actinomycetota bacterium]MDA3015541.1 PIN domain-containing protein [Actinomycetota bacterium]MDA3027876.1 PIN domain-containing protein [Actinomycetota bacterium]
MLLLDSSALLAATVDGPHRPSMLDAMSHHDVRCASALALAEALPAIDRLTDDPIQRADLEDALRITWDFLYVVPVDAGCLEIAAELARRRMMRMTDAIHLAAATRLPSPVVFATVDPSQISLAAELGFEVWST